MFFIWSTNLLAEIRLVRIYTVMFGDNIFLSSNLYQDYYHELTKKEKARVLGKLTL